MLRVHCRRFCERLCTAEPLSAGGPIGSRSGAEPNDKARPALQFHLARTGIGASGWLLMKIIGKWVLGRANASHTNLLDFTKVNWPNFAVYPDFLLVHI
jgi:hypothetical protein